MSAPRDPQLAIRYARESVEQRVQRERDGAVSAEWAQIDRIGRVVATCLEGTAAELREIEKLMIYDRTSGLARLESVSAIIDEAALQLRSWRLPPDANVERKAAGT